MRLCLNSFALKSGPDEDEMVAQCLKKGLNAAMSTIQTHFESSQTDLALSFATDVSCAYLLALWCSRSLAKLANVPQYLTITLAQAAIFLVRITKSPLPVQAVVDLDHSVVAHYLKMSVDLLESADISETRLSSYLAKTIRDISRAAGIAGMGPVEYADDKPAVDMRTSHTEVIEQEVTPFDLGSFFQIESQLDMGYLLGLPGDNSAMQLGGGVGGFGSNGYSSEFGFGMGGIAMGLGSDGGM